MATKPLPKEKIGQYTLVKRLENYSKLSTFQASQENSARMVKHAMCNFV